MERVLLIEGSKCRKNFPNLALMKLSAYHKGKGDIVALNKMNNPDRVYISSPFSRPLSNLYIYNHKNIPTKIGGYGINGDKLPNDIEHIMPDYDLYGIDYSMGFTSRGCINKCPFCVVPKYEGLIKNHQFVSEFLHPDHKKVILMDNSFTNSPKFKENSRYLIDKGIEVSISQGINIRTLTEEKANILKELKLKNWTFKANKLYFAWDLMKDEELVRKGIQILLNAGFKKYMLSCYVLVNYNSTFEEDLYRCNTLWNEFGILPFVMSYKGKHPLQRWANFRFIKYCDFKDFDYKKYKRKK